MKHSVPFRLIDPADGASSVRRWAVAALLASGLAIGTGFASAQEVGTATPTVIASATADTTATTAPSDIATAEPSATPVTSATVVATATPEDTRVERLADHLNELETALGDRLSDESKAQIARVRESLTELLTFTNGIDDGSILPSNRVRAEFKDLVHDLRSDLNELKDDVRDDIHGIAKNGGGLAMAGIQHSLKLIKFDVDVVIREEKQDLKVALRHGRRDDDDDRAQPTTITGTPTHAASPTAGTTPISGTPTAVAKVDDDDDHKSTGRSKRRDHDEDEDEHRERERASSLPPVVSLLPIQGLPVPFLPATTRVQPAARNDDDDDDDHKSTGRSERRDHDEDEDEHRGRERASKAPKQAEVKHESKREAPKQAEVKNESKREASKSDKGGDKGKR